MNKLRKILFIAYCGFIVWYTIISRKPGISKADLRFMWSYQEILLGDPHWKEDVLQNLQNIAFFIPVGIMLPVKKWKSVLVLALVFSTVIENTQYIGGYGLAELDDVICNTLGAMIGFWIILNLKKLFVKHARGRNAV